jgi:hypothetical protein
MDSCIILQPAKVVPERPFSDPAASKDDVTIIRAMIAHLCDLLARSNSTPPIHLDRQEEDGTRHRLVVPNWRALQRKRDLIAVSFFGQLRPQVDHEPIDALEEDIREQLPKVRGLLAYYNLLQPDRGYGNLVLFRSEQAKARWRNNKEHGAAVNLTPRHYYSVRLHNGVIRGGLDSGAYELVRTKYYDYRNGSMWRAIRESYL